MENRFLEALQEQSCEYHELVLLIRALKDVVRFNSLYQKSLKCSYLLMQHPTPRHLFGGLLIYTRKYVKVCLLHYL